jgi:hypothetical protein
MTKKQIHNEVTTDKKFIKLLLKFPSAHPTVDNHGPNPDKSSMFRQVLPSRAQNYAHLRIIAALTNLILDLQETELISEHESGIL